MVELSEKEQVTKAYKEMDDALRILQSPYKSGEVEANTELNLAIDSLRTNLFQQHNRYQQGDISLKELQGNWKETLEKSKADIDAATPKISLRDKLSQSIQHIKEKMLLTLYSPLFMLSGAASPSEIAGELGKKRAPSLKEQRVQARKSLDSALEQYGNKTEDSQKKESPESGNKQEPPQSGLG